MNNMNKKGTIKSGWLTKKGHIIKNWKKRYFILTNYNLSYYTDAILSKKKGEFLFPPNELVHISLSNFPDTSSIPYRFALQNNASGAYLELCAMNSKEKNEWIKIINNIMEGIYEKEDKVSPPYYSPSVNLKSTNLGNKSGRNTENNDDENGDNVDDIDDDQDGFETSVLDENDLKEMKRLSEARNYFLASDSESEDDGVYTENLKLQQVRDENLRLGIDSDDESSDIEEVEMNTTSQDRKIEKDVNKNSLENESEVLLDDRDSSIKGIAVKATETLTILEESADKNINESMTTYSDDDSDSSDEWDDDSVITPTTETTDQSLKLPPLPPPPPPVVVSDNFLVTDYDIKIDEKIQLPELDELL